MLVVIDRSLIKNSKWYHALIAHANLKHKFLWELTFFFLSPFCIDCGTSYCPYLFVLDVINVINIEQFSSEKTVHIVSFLSKIVRYPVGEPHALTLLLIGDKWFHDFLVRLKL
jgi:hypothetical protein